MLQPSGMLVVDSTHDVAHAAVHTVFFRVTQHTLPAPQSSSPSQCKAKAQLVALVWQEKSDAAGITG